MKSILFDNKGANSLNQLIQTKVARHLFVICNYNPTTFGLISDDARFLEGISNLYKFAIDSSLINKLRKIDDNLGGVCFKNNKREFVDHKKCLDEISVLRTFAFHNNDHNEIIEQVESWITHVIKKKKFESMEDYACALRELEVLAEKTFDLSRTIINTLADTYTKNDLQDAFQNEIISFYNINKRIIDNELRQAFRSQMVSPGAGLVKKSYVANWCKNMYCGKYEQKIKLFLQYQSSAKGEDRRRLDSAIADTKKQLTEIMQKVADNSDKCQGDIDKLNAYDYLDYYSKDVVERGLSKLPEIKKHGYTMLPQDMIQYFVSSDFQGVTIDMD